jgi:hypothetical protein
MKPSTLQKLRRDIREPGSLSALPNPEGFHCVIARITITVFLALAAAVSAKAQVSCGNDVLRTQKHSLAMTLLLVEDSYRAVFKVADRPQSAPEVQATPLAYVCPEVYSSFKEVYKNYDGAHKDLFELTFSNMKKQVIALSPSGARYGGGGVCPKGPELHDLFK